MYEFYRFGEAHTILNYPSVSRKGVQLGTPYPVKMVLCLE